MAGLRYRDDSIYDGRQAGDVGGGYVFPVVPPPANGGTPLGNVWPDGTNIELGTTAGSRIGTDPAQKVGFYGAVPVPRPASLTAAAPAVAGAAGAAYTATEQGLINDLVALAANLVTRVNELEARLQSMGFLP